MGRPTDVPKDTRISMRIDTKTKEILYKEKEKTGKSISKIITELIKTLKK